MNRKERRDAARAEGKIAPLVPDSSPPKRKWAPEADTPVARPAKPHADTRLAERRSRDSDRPEGFKPRGPKGPAGKSFKPRGDKPFAKSFGGKPGGKPFRGKPAGKRDSRG